MDINHDILDLVLVTSLGILAVSSVVFLSFFIPVLIQFSKTLEASHALLSVFKNYAVALQDSVGNAKKGAAKMASYVSEFVGSITESVVDLFFKKK